MHSSSVGPIDEDEIFYLRAWHPRDAARKFIVLGFWSASSRASRSRSAGSAPDAPRAQVAAGSGTHRAGRLIDAASGGRTRRGAPAAESFSAQQFPRTAEKR